jgi:2-keto-4-pentenoate hydratase/2-oxohepta-3-ene-1,7-dioic acid hydratase in catechol pathway
MKATSSINGPNDNIEIVQDSKNLDWEVELGIIIGKEAKHIDEKSITRSYFRILFSK